jgi:AraC-like DNA-binding protein
MVPDDLYRLISAGEWLSLRPPAEMLQELRGLVASLPHVGSLADQLLIRALVVHALARVGLALQFELYPRLIQAYLVLAATPWSTDGWVLAFAQVAERFELALRDTNDLGSGASSLEVRVSKALRLINGHYANPQLSVQLVADQSGLSASHLTYAIKLQTGEGFVVHLRRRRVEAARHLLEKSVLSIKQIAAAVGYGSTRHFERDFKRVYGTTPKGVRGGPQPDSEPGEETGG